MKYYIDSNFTLCGWDGLPFAIMDKKTKRSVFMNRAQFKLLWSCDAYTDINLDEVDGDNLQFFNWLLKAGVVHEAPEDMRLQLHDYKLYPCRYRSNVHFSITGQCNYRCRHCFQSAPHAVLGQPTVKEICDELDQMVECGIFEVSITGGEPLVHDGFWDIVDHIIENDMILTTMYSNGKLVDEALLDGFEARGIKPSWSISFDGLGTHDFIRGVDGAEEAAIKAIKLLVSRGYNVGCAYTLAKRTAPVFRDTVNYLASLGVHSLKSGHTMPQGEWLDCPNEWLSDQDYIDFYCEYIPQYLADGRPLNLQFEGLFSGQSDATLEREKKMKERGLEYNDDSAQIATCDDDPRDPKYATDAAKEEEAEEEKLPYYFMTDRELTDEQMSKYLSCGVLTTAFYVGPTGNVLPCMGLDGLPAAKDFPNMRVTPLREILQKDSYFIKATGATMKDVLEHNPEECADCEVKSHCGSGCRASAVAEGNPDYLACDKRTCLICKEDWAGKVKAAIAAAGDSGIAE